MQGICTRFWYETGTDCQCVIGSTALIGIIAIAMDAGKLAANFQSNYRALATGISLFFTVNVFDIRAIVSVTEFGRARSAKSIFVTDEAPDIQKAFSLQPQTTIISSGIYGFAAMYHGAVGRKGAFALGNQAIEWEIV
ncbi:hypothetical protein DXU04_35020 [Bradyrhizobium diazoefficiens]|nr:hypothetical protein BD122_26340 [Bradyrhizobium diazoefficiens]KOY10849.1 hypothetical protein AF336_07820 [Bradyrhizobium diazoefficiens]